MKSSSKQTPDQIRRIVRMLDAGHSLRAIAHETQLNYRTIARIRDDLRLSGVQPDLPGMPKPQQRCEDRTRQINLWPQ